MRAATLAFGRCDRAKIVIVLSGCRLVFVSTLGVGSFRAACPFRGSLALRRHAYTQLKTKSFVRQKATIAMPPKRKPEPIKVEHMRQHKRPNTLLEHAQNAMFRHNRVNEPGPPTREGPQGLHGLNADMSESKHLRDKRRLKAKQSRRQPASEGVSRKPPPKGH